MRADKTSLATAVERLWRRRTAGVSQPSVLGRQAEGSLWADGSVVEADGGEAELVEAVDQGLDLVAELDLLEHGSLDPLHRIGD